MSIDFYILNQFNGVDLLWAMRCPIYVSATSLVIDNVLKAVDRFNDKKEQTCQNIM